MQHRLYKKRGNLLLYKRFLFFYLFQVVCIAAAAGWVAVNPLASHVMMYRQARVFLHTHIQHILMIPSSACFSLLANCCASCAVECPNPSTRVCSNGQLITIYIRQHQQHRTNNEDSTADIYIYTFIYCILGIV
jgi:hypothetical protein